MFSSGTGVCISPKICTSNPDPGLSRQWPWPVVRRGREVGGDGGRSLARPGGGSVWCSGIRRIQRSRRWDVRGSCSVYTYLSNVPIENACVCCKLIVWIAKRRHLNVNFNAYPTCIRCQTCPWIPKTDLWIWSQGSGSRIGSDHRSNPIGFADRSTGIIDLPSQ